LYGPLSWTVVDSPELANPPEKRTLSRGVRQPGRGSVAGRLHDCSEVL